MSFGYWLWRSVKTIICIICYYGLLLLAGVVLYPRGSLLDMSRGEKLGLSLNIAILAVFMIVSTIVIANRLLRKKTWYHRLSPFYSYLVFGIVHFIFVYFMNKSLSAEVVLHICIFIVFSIISIILSLINIKKFECVQVEEDVDDVLRFGDNV